MKIRNRILLYYSVAINLITAVTLVVIYLLFADYREEQFLQQQRERIKTTLQLFSELTREDDNIQQTMDILTVYDYYDEKLMIFDSNKQLLYVSKEDIPTPDVPSILNQLSRENPVLKTNQGLYEIVGIFTESRGDTFFAISKAFDELGYTKMQFLRNLMIAIFLAIAAVVVLISHFLSKKITSPITQLTARLKNYDLTDQQANILPNTTSTFEIVELTDKFNELLSRTREAFAFQKHTVHHISHQLKTPIAVIVSELERLMTQTDEQAFKNDLQNQIVKAKSLGTIINVLLEISKIEAGQAIVKTNIRVDELIFDVINELNIIAPDFVFDLHYYPQDFEEKSLIVNANPILIRQAFLNLLNNCTAYSDDSRAEIRLDCSHKNEIRIKIINTGPSVSEEEEKLMFNHFFRGKNSENVQGFGLGLVLTKKIFELHHATITYSNPGGQINIFEVVIPLS